MFPSSRGSAGVAAVVLAAVILLLAVWLFAGVGAGARSDKLRGAIEALDDARVPGIDASEARDLRARADALLKRLDQQVESVPADVRLGRAKAPVEDLSPAGVDGLAATLEDSVIVLTWRATGDEPAMGYRVERVAADGTSLTSVRVAPDVLSYRDEPVDALKGRRNYRVSALGRDGTVAGLQQKTVPYRQAFTVSYLGAGEDGTARFRVGWERAGQRLSEAFDVARGGTIGKAVPAKEDRPALDFGTGWRYTGLAGSRKVETREASVPRFTGNGTLMRNPETGKAIFEVRKMPVAGIVEGAEVETPREDGAVGHLWLEKLKDG